MKFEVLKTNKPDCSFLDGGVETSLNRINDQQIWWAALDIKFDGSPAPVYHIVDITGRSTLRVAVSRGD
jgi:hypothetical protein